MGFLNEPTTELVSPPLFHDENHFLRNECKESSSRTIEAECTQKQHDTKTQNADCQPSTAYQYAAGTNQNTGVLKKDEGNNVTTSTATARPVRLKRGSADIPASCLIGKPGTQKAQHSRPCVSRGSADFPLPSKTEAVSASPKTHTIVHTILSTAPVYPPLTRIEAGSFTRNAQIRTAVHPFSTAEAPQQ